jgi:hypothetical protein
MRTLLAVEWKRRPSGLILSVAALVLVLLAAGAHSASGHRKHGFGGLWPHTPGEHLHLPYAMGGRGLTSGYVDVINRAMLAWYQTRTWVWPYHATSGNKLYFHVGRVNDTFFGYATNYEGERECTGSGCRYTFSQLIINRSTLDAESRFTKQKVVAHEFGHALGLSHPCSSGRCPRRVRTVMNQGILRYNVPQNHDVNDVNRMYP